MNQHPSDLPQFERLDPMTPRQFVENLEHVDARYTLAERIRTHPACLPGSKLMEHALALESLTDKTPVRERIGVWTRARRYWCALTGESFA